MQVSNGLLPEGVHWSLPLSGRVAVACDPSAGPPGLPAGLAPWPSDVQRPGLHTRLLSWRVKLEQIPVTVE